MGQNESQMTDSSNTLPLRGSSTRQESNAEPVESAAHGTNQPATSPSPSSKRLRAYDNDLFKTNLSNHGVNIYEALDEVSGPANLSELKARLARPRNALFQSSFNQHVYSDLLKTVFSSFRHLAGGICNEEEVMKRIWSDLIGDNDIPQLYPSKANSAMKDLAHLTDGNLVFAKPDFWDGVYKETLSETVRNDLQPYIMPSKSGSLPSLPNFFMEAKGPGGNPSTGRLQAAYDGALGARAVHAVREYIDQTTVIDGAAYAFTSTLVCGAGMCTLTLYACYIARGKIGLKSPSSDDTMSPSSKPNKLEIHITNLARYDLCQSLSSFTAGITALRNMRDYAAEVRLRLVEAANTAAHYKQIQAQSNEAVEVLVKQIQRQRAKELDEAVEKERKRMQEELEKERKEKWRSGWDMCMETCFQEGSDMAMAQELEKRERELEQEQREQQRKAVQLQNWTVNVQIQTNTGAPASESGVVGSDGDAMQGIEVNVPVSVPVLSN